MESPIRNVSAFTVLSLPVLSLAKKNKAEKRLATMVISAKTIIIFISMAMSNPVFEQVL